MLGTKKAFVHKLLIAASPSASFATAKCNPKAESFPGGFQAFTTRKFVPWCNSASNGNPFTFLQLSNIVMSDYNAAYAFNQDLFDEAVKKLPHGVNENFQLYDSAGSMKQHLYFVGSRIRAGADVQEVFERGLLFPVYIASIHPDTFMFYTDSPIGKALSKKGQSSCTRTNFIRENRKEINADNDIIIEEILKNNGKIPAGLSVYINGNIIDVAQFKKTKLENGKVRVTFQAITWTDEHSLSGQATHCFEFDPNFPDEIMYFVWGSGEGWLIADMTNGPISSILWKAVADTIVPMYTSMKESGTFETAARDKAWSGLVCRLWTKSQWAATRRFLASTFMSFTTPAGVEIKRRITDSTYNKGALVQYVPFDISKWEKEYKLVPGNLIDLGAYDWDNITLEAMSAMADPSKLDESKPRAEDTLGGALFLGHLVNGSALMQPSYTLAMTDLAVSKLSNDDLDVIKKAYEKVVLANLKDESNMTTVPSGPWKGTGAAVRQYWAWAALSPYRVELEKVAAKQVGSKATRSEISEFIDALHAQEAVLPKGD
ncbi:hypothetical protein FBEOM_14438 [Fusarium beomiforme]|uniref:Uncharacterized protein n=1 Tax=Fusarium beomiforme TaxID=44412 RepID=A0A9P5A4I3_9HYPO|nr:hypothetical protein FBEOM_14438 [Fusarium beomiforme]